MTDLQIIGAAALQIAINFSVVLIVGAIYFIRSDKGVKR